VTVLRDRWGVPHIYADSAEDLFRAQGYVHAQDRFWEMDFRRHVTAGRLSELFGATTLDTDKVVRTLGWRRVAERELGLISARTRRYLEVYAEGVNAWMRWHTGGPGEPGVRDSALPERRLPTGAVDTSRFAGLAQGDGLGLARERGRGAGTSPRCRDDARASCGPALPGLSLRPASDDRRRRRGRQRQVDLRDASPPAGPWRPADRKSGV